MFIKRKAQSTLEFLALVTIIIGVFIATGSYFKRGLQGRWKTAVDELGDQYDPRLTNTDMNHTLSAFTEVRITTVDTAGGFYTMREDQQNATESSTGFSRIGAANEWGL